MSDKISASGARKGDSTPQSLHSSKGPPPVLIERTASGAIASNIDYDTLFATCLRTMELLGGKITESNQTGGILEARWRYGVNLFGLRVRALFATSGGKSEIVFRGRFADAIDSSGAAARKAAEVESAFARELQSQTGGSAPLPPPAASGSRQKSKAAVAVLGLIVGGLGVHRFYLGTWGIGLVYLLILAPASVVSGLPLTIIIAVADAIHFFAMRQTRFERRYGANAIRPFTV